MVGKHPAQKEEIKLRKTIGVFELPEIIEFSFANKWLFYATRSTSRHLNGKPRRLSQNIDTYLLEIWRGCVGWRGGQLNKAL